MIIFAGALRQNVAPLLSLLLLGLPLAYGAYLAWQEWHYRQSLAVPVATPTRIAPAPVLKPFKPDAIVSVMGLSPEGTLAQSAEPLELRASFVYSQGASYALLAGKQHSQFYRVGERLPGGSVLRRVEVSQVVLWRNNREERLLLRPASQHLIPTTQTAATPPKSSSLHLRPLAEQP
ncbi:type II secretion system protein N [Pseudomonas endophytica]|uniref:type II secretion system protein N n=1 Tax=Pseudomonas endophytica TaxID=1563157 RepID=UPI001F4D008D|nr:type II secretion system protein N [Pseudomonas endophytica]